MKFYIASAWTNKEPVRDLAAVLKRAGHTQTYDWTKDQEGEGWEQRAYQSDVAGVLDADAVIIILPARRGAHVELGIAIATGKPILILMENEGDVIEGGYGCPFYYGPQMKRVVGSFHDWVREVLRVMANG